jgi:benzoate membrane transport protein
MSDVGGRAEPPRPSSLPAVMAGFTSSIVFLAVLGIMLAAAGPNGLGLPEDLTATWIAVVYGLPMLPTLILTIRYRTPIPFTGNVFAIIFFASLGQRISFPELCAASISAGAIVLATGAFGITGRLARWIPTPVVQGVIAGAVMPFVIEVFSSMSVSGGEWRLPAVVLATLVAYFASQRVLGATVPPILPAFVVGLLAALVTGQLGPLPTSFDTPGLEPIRPAFTWTAILTVTPVLVALMTVQANIPSLVYLRTQGFDPPTRLVDLVSGVGSILGSFFGPVPMAVALPPVLVMGGPAAGPVSLRYRATFLPVALGIGIALFAGTAADLAVLFPPALLLAIAGLALLPALIVALRAITAGPLVLGPVLAFAIALSDLSVAGFDPFFWSLVLGTIVSLVFERDGWRELRARLGDDEGREGSLDRAERPT